MHPFEKKILKNCYENKLFASGDGVVVGVSGGPDSMAMLYALDALADLLEISIFIGHANHGLRSGESAAEENFVGKQAKKLGLNCQVAPLKVRDLARDAGLSIEHAARKLRYEFFAEVRGLYQAEKIAVAHNADDQAEEVLLRLFRGTGVKGLAGMEMNKDNYLIRPLLNITRAEIMAYIGDKNIPYMVDSSNKDRRFRRNKVRLDLLPRLAIDFNPNIKNILRQTATILQDENRVLEGITDNVYRHVVIEDIDESGEVIIKVVLADFRKLDKAIKRRIFERVILALNRKPGFKQIESLLRAVDSTPHEIHLAGGLRVFKEGDFLCLSFPVAGSGKRQNLIDIAMPEFKIFISKPGRYKIPQINRTIVVEIIDGSKGGLELKDSEADYLDNDKLSYPLEIRNKIAGDSFKPLGCSGHKKVGKILSDLKIPGKTRRMIPVLVSEKHIVALPGIRINHDFRVTASTRKVMKLTMQNGV